MAFPYDKINYLEKTVGVQEKQLERQAIQLESLEAEIERLKNRLILWNANRNSLDIGDI